MLVAAASEKVIDIAVKTKTCTPCKKQLPHATCYKNYNGTSGGMETAGMVEIFNRSENDQLQYTTFIGDGDSAVETALKTEVSYGHLIEKIDCINHKVKVILMGDILKRISS